MGLAGKICIAIVAVTAAILIQTGQDITKPLPLPKLDPNEYWGPHALADYKEDTTIRRLNISYSSTTINKLKFRLEQSLEHIPDSLEDAKFHYGFNSEELIKIIKYWKDTYLKKWSVREDFIKQFDHFTTEIQGLKIHFIRSKPKLEKGVKIYPILLLHGWPSSVREFYEIIPKLTQKVEGKNFVFEVIAPSLPGFGWSKGSSRQGLGYTEMSVIFHNLMLRLGHNKFFIHGGDWGSEIGNNIATLYPENVIGFHSNGCISNTMLAYLKQIFASIMPRRFTETKYVKWFFPLRQKVKFLLQESGFAHLQASKPDTIGIVLSNNPVGLAAYILEKFSTFTNPANLNTTDGGLEKDFGYDALLDNVMIYYLTNSITTSIRIYYESTTLHELSYHIDRSPVVAPFGCARFQYDAYHMVDWAIIDKFPKLIHNTYHENGGHFASLQLPDILSADILQFASKVIKK